MRKETIFLSFFLFGYVRSINLSITYLDSIYLMENMTLYVCVCFVSLFWGRS